MSVCVFRSFRDQLAEVLLPFFMKQWQFVRCSDATWQLQVHVSSLPLGPVLAELFLVKMSLQKDAFAATILVPILDDTGFIRYACEEIRWLQSSVVSPLLNSAVCSSEHGSPITTCGSRISVERSVHAGHVRSHSTTGKHQVRFSMGSDLQTTWSEIGH